MESDVPLFAQVASAIRGEAVNGRLKPGDRLPPAREVASALGINLHTVLRGYQELRDEGLIDMRRGRGAVLTDAVRPLMQLHEDILVLSQRARALGMHPETLAALVKEIAGEH